jgi:hypothetical protein
LEADGALAIHLALKPERVDRVHIPPAGRTCATVLGSGNLKAAIELRDTLPVRKTVGFRNRADALSLISWGRRSCYRRWTDRVLTALGRALE